MPLPRRIAFLSLAVVSLLSAADGEPAAPLVHVPPGALVLRDGWRIESSRVVPRPDREITAVGFDDSWWHPVTVPTTVLHALVKEGVYPDPKIGFNNQRIPDINDAFNEQFHQGKFSTLPPTSNPMNPWNKPWWFRKEFDAPVEYQGKKVWLNFGGINYRADVWLNGQRVADARNMAGMFQRFRFDVTDAIRPGQRNCLAVLVHPWDVEARGQEPPELFNGTGRTDREAFRNVSAQSLGGWDYVLDAADRGTGIWQDVFLETSGPVLLEHPDVVTTELSPDNDAAKLTVRVFARNTAAERKTVTLRVRLAPKTFDGGGKAVEFAAPVELAAGETREIFLKPEDHSELTLQSPHLWWPRAYGNPDLYHVQISAEADGASSYRAEMDFGVRTVDTKILPTGGREFSSTDAKSASAAARGSWTRCWKKTCAVTRRRCGSAWKAIIRCCGCMGRASFRPTRSWMRATGKGCCCGRNSFRTARRDTSRRRIIPGMTGARTRASISIARGTTSCACAVIRACSSGWDSTRTGCRASYTILSMTWSPASMARIISCPVRTSTATNRIG